MPKIKPAAKIHFTGPRLRKWREDRSLSQTELADLLGVSRFYILRLETGTKKITTVTQLAMHELTRRLPVEEGVAS